jgi:hypothetical protein
MHASPFQVLFQGFRRVRPFRVRAEECLAPSPNAIGAGCYMSNIMPGNSGEAYPDERLQNYDRQPQTLMA